MPINGILYGLKPKCQLLVGFRYGPLGPKAVECRIVTGSKLGLGME